MDKTELEQKVAMASEKQRILDSHIKPFIEERTQRLFQSFINTPADDVDQLQLIKMQTTVLAALEAEFQAHIDDGKLAKKELENMQ